MRSDRKKVPLSEFITLQRGFDLPSKDRIDGTVPVVASTQITGWHNESKVEGPGVVIGRSGSIGGGQFISEDFWPLNTTLWVKNFKNHDPEFVYYLLRSIDFERFNVGSGVPTLNRNHLSSVEVPLFNEEEEVEIANQLGTLDKKIHLNRQTNETLEAMAQAIFKSWFVDFDPVRAKIEATSAGRDPNRAAMAAISAATKVSADGAVLWDETEAALDQKLARMSEAQQQQLSRTAQLFPDELVDSEIGEVPKGWEVVELKEVIENFDRKRVPLSRREREERPGRYPYYGATSVMDYIDDYLFDGRNVLMAEDGSVIDDNGKPVLQYIDGKIWVNNHAHVLNGKEPITNEILYLFLQNVNISPYITGAVQKKINQGNMNSIPFLLGDVELYEIISPILKGFFDKIIQNENENESLERLRDTLLPKLISGEVGV